MAFELRYEEGERSMVKYLLYDFGLQSNFDQMITVRKLELACFKSGLDFSLYVEDIGLDICINLLHVLWSQWMFSCCRWRVFFLKKAVLERKLSENLSMRFSNE